MKHMCMFCCLLLLTAISGFAQNDSNTSGQTSEKTRFSIKAGYTGISVRSKAEGSEISSTASDGGVSFGIGLDIPLSGSWYIEPSALYGSIDSESWLFIPVMAKYYVADQFSIMAGPQGTFSFEDKEGLPINTFGLDLGFGLGYDFSDAFFIEARFATEITNRTSEGIEVTGFDDSFDPSLVGEVINLKTRATTYFITLGYRFN